MVDRRRTIRRMGLPARRPVPRPRRPPRPGPPRSPGSRLGDHRRPLRSLRPGLSRGPAAVGDLPTTLPGRPRQSARGRAERRTGSWSTPSIRRTGRTVNAKLADTWGYVFNAYMTMAIIDPGVRALSGRGGPGPRRRRQVQGLRLGGGQRRRLCRRDRGRHQSPGPPPGRSGRKMGRRRDRVPLPQATGRRHRRRLARGRQLGPDGPDVRALEDAGNGRGALAGRPPPGGRPRRRR